MNKEERYIIDKAGRENPFRVPQGYFEDFATKMMDSLPERNTETTSESNAGISGMKPEPKRRWLRPLVAAAACVALVFGTVSYLQRLDSDSAMQQGTTMDYLSETSFEDELADYAMLDNMDIYAYLADE